MGRLNIDVADMSFTCVTIHPNWTALAPENSLIQHYADLNLSEWNGIGFGPHDPGRNRDTTNADPEGFDTQFPIRHEWPCEFIEARHWNIRELLIRMKEELPFLLRYECINRNYRAGHADYNDRTVVVPQNGLGASELLALITQRIPGWQSTRFPGYMILYREHTAYVHGTVIHQQPT